MRLTELTDFLDKYLKVDEIEDIALNGLQVEGGGEVNKIATATDACSETIHKAASLKSDLLLTHHGIFWGTVFAIKGMHAERIKTLLTNGISLYSAHLPLDAHPEVGNNVELVKLLDFELAEPFGVYHGVSIGYIGRRKTPLDFDTLIKKLEDGLNARPAGYNFGPGQITTIGVISGNGTSMLEQVRGTDIDLFLTGEQDHTGYHLAKELNINLVFAGHYATETLGVRSLGNLIQEKFGIESVFIDVPTGL